MKTSPLARLLIATASLVAFSHAAHAQAWPAKPIRLVVPYAAGGPADVIARLVAKPAGANVGQTIIVDNKGGAGGTIGVDAALKSPPDGYTFALVAQGPLAGMPNLMKVPYALNDVQFLTLVARGPAVIVVSKDVPANSLPEFIKLAKASPGKFNYGSAGPGTTPHIGAELLKQEAGIELTHVPYKGAAPGGDRRCSAARCRSRWSTCSTCCRTWPAASSRCWRSPARAARRSCPTCRRPRKPASPRW